MSWVEKYRPKKPEDFVGNEKIVQNVFSMLDDEAAGKDLCPHLLFTGKEGIGKTTLIGILRSKYGFTDCVEVNASKSARMETLRTTLDKFFKTTSVDSMGKRKMLILEEFDNSSAAFQAAFRRDMETYAKRVLVVATANFENKIIAPVLSRFCVERFNPVSDEDIVKLLKNIASKEGIVVKDDILGRIASACHGKPRDAVQLFQSGKGKFVNDTELLVKVKLLLTCIRETPVFAFKEMRKLVNEVPNPRRILEFLLDMLVFEEEVSSEVKSKAARILGKYDYRMVEGGIADIQMAALVAELAQLLHN